ncbi:Na+/H+ antiporter [Calidifontibacter sp. DB0510]|uniref:Na+/H+ antiporter n=1 Tax=Metallococcus carri TaxID=1656884 RepID=A0A967E996_9MICO|nr:Na+/H+ antiporter [Metallococcus carri]NHN54634.1 Na+/H+ antiporter [Metallococcus carri]NOP36527.1 Na+/H+ antiporter [Calidifontibacter sp. DB2511S]
MQIALALLALTATVVAVAAIARRIGLSAPLLLTAVGIGAGFLPFVPDVAVEPEVILLGFLPPLLYATAINTSLIDLGRNRFQILSLSVVAVLVTAFAVGGVAWALLTAVPFSIAVALGGVVAPPDAVAATAVARRIGLPRRVVAVLEGESLFNDATALVTVSTAVAAFTGSLSVGGTLLDFARAALGGVLIGYVAAKLIALVRKHITDTLTSVALSFMTPWIAYLPAEELHSSGVIAVVVCGVLVGHQAPRIQTAQSRMAERINWASIQFLLENLVFLLIGLQVHQILTAVQHSRLGLARTALFAAAVLVTVLLVRPLYVLTWAYVGRRFSIIRDPLRPRESAIVSWAGMRGVVTLAAAFLLPSDTPEREALVFTALVVAIGTLALQGFSLGWVARRLDLHGPDPREDALQRAQLMQLAINAGERRLDDVLADAHNVPDEVVSALRTQSDRRANAAWERLGLGSAESETPGQSYRRLRGMMLDAERGKVITLRDKGVMDHDVLSEVMSSLDIEESMLTVIDDREANSREQLLLTPEQRQFGCEHLNCAPAAVEPLTPEGCPECLRDGTNPVHLRLCLECGHVGCCDSSVGRHATRHFEETGHAVMRSFEPGEAWRWCYIDQRLG